MPITLDVAKKLILRYLERYVDRDVEYGVADAYYKSHNDIALPKLGEVPGGYVIDDSGALVVKEENPLRRADNRISNGFYPLLVKQKASYAFTQPPTFDVGDERLNDTIVATLGDKFAKVCKNVCTDAANAGVGWIHYWIDPRTNKFKYAVVPASQIYPITTDELDDELDAVLRIYYKIEEETGDGYYIYEYWNDSECQTFRRREDLEMDGLEACNAYNLYIGGTMTGETVGRMSHIWGGVPFIQFANNDIKKGDLLTVKPLIDAYDKVYSGFLNDLEDVQQIIMVLSGYEGEDMNEFLGKLNRYKTINVNPNDGSGISTLSIEIPVEAREKMLTLTRKSIFEQGQGIDPDPSNFGNSSGVALGYLYSLLELKTGLMETEFRLGFAELVRAICRNAGFGDPKKIIQTWTRTAVNNDTELAAIAKDSVGIISKKTIVKNHPWVDDPEKEMDEIEKEADEEKEQADQTDYPGLGQGGQDNASGQSGEGETGGQVEEQANADA